MEDKKKKKQDEKKKKEAAQKKATEQITKVPDSAKPDPAPPLPPVNPSAAPAVPPSSGNGKRAPSGGQPQTAQQPQTPLQQRYPPREVPPRFRQQEHKQLLKRGQPLPPGTLPLTNTGRPNTTEPAVGVAIHPSPSCASSSTASLPTELPPQSGQAAQYDNPLWGHLPANRSATSAASSTNLSGWDQLIIDQKDTEAWPSITISQSQAPPGGCPLDTDPGRLTSSSSSSSTSSSCSTVIMATGANSQTGHFPANQLSSKANSGPSPASHSGTSMLSSQVAANRSWGSGSGPSHCPPQSSVGSEGKSDSPVAGGGGRGWGSSSSSSTNNFNLNLNPSANPSAWPMLGHDGGSTGGGSSGGANTISTPQPTPNLCNPPGPPPAQTSTCTGANTNSNSSVIGSAWGSMMTSDTSESHPSPSTNVSFSSEPQNLKTDGPNHTNKQEPPSPIRNLPGWGNAPVGLGSMGQPQSGGPQVNGEDGSSAWVNSGDSKAPSSKEAPGWDSGWGHGGNRAGNSGGWGDQSGRGWGKQHTEEKQGGWDTPSSPPQDTQTSPWNRAVSTAGASEGSSDSMEGHPRQRDHSARDNPAPLLPAQDLDPRVLCNTGWGQTPVRQHTSWDMEDAKRKKEASESWGSGPSTPNDTQGPTNTNMGPSQRADPGSKNDVPGSQGASGWGGGMAATNQPGSGWGEQPNNVKPQSGHSGWGTAPATGPPPSIPKNGGQSWGSHQEEKSSGWDDPNIKTTSQGWGDQPKASHSWSSSGGSNNSGDWREAEESKKSPTNPGWEGEAGGAKENPRGWGMPTPTPGISGSGGNGGWGEPVSQRTNAPTNGPPQSWGPSGNGGGGGMGSWSGPAPVKQSGGWTGSKQESSAEPTGWEEPSPPSIRRKMEIDDGTSAWGDPVTYTKSVNLWDRNNPGTSQAKVPPGGNNPPGPNNNNNNHPPSHNHTYHGPPAPLQNHTSNSQNPGPTSGPMDPVVQHQTGPSHSRGPLISQGWGENPSSHPKSESTWGEPAPPPVSVDNGTSAWGKPTGSCGGWGGDNNPDNYIRGNSAMTTASCKPAPKPMQDGWGGGGEDLNMSGGQWDAEEGDMWNNTASQESNSSCNSWGNASKKVPQKIKVPVKQEDAWIMNRLIKQLTDMGFPRDPAEEALKSNNMNLDQAMSALLEKKTELDKRGMGMTGHDYNNGLINKPMSCPRPPLLSKDPSADPRLPFMDKQMQSGMFGGGGAAQARAMQQPQPPPQPPVPPLSSSQPSLRAQVPQFLSPQVQAQLLQFAAKNIGLNPALLTSPINPQHMTLLNQLYQLQLAYQRLQIQQQMLQAQRNVSGPIRQQEQQVARTINNMQQQIQQHQRQLAQALLMKQQQQQPPPSHSGLHPGGTKSTLDSFPGHPQAPGLSDLQTKEPQSSPNTYSPYSLSGLNQNMNVNCMEVGGLSMKEPPQPQSRLSQWTHPNSIESLSGSSSPLEPNLGKHGANLGPPGKPHQLEDSYSPYNLMSSSESPTSPLVPPDSWGQGKSNSDKMSNGTNINWPPEFCPGVPWKGLQNIDPENDPNMTPGSVPSGPTINTNIQDVNRYLLRDRSGGKMSEMKSTWSSGPISHSQAPLAHELWKVPQGNRGSNVAPSRPPPGLTNTKPSSTWGNNSLGLAQGWSSSYTSAGTTWSTDSSNRTSSWLVLRNLTPQIDGSTLRTLCMQHGPLITFHLNLTQGNAVVRYSSKDEAAKAQKSLHMCVLGNTTILAEFAGEEEVNRFFAQGQLLGGTTSWQATPGTNQTRMGGAGSGASHPIGHSPHWNNNNGSNSSSSSSGLGTGGAKTGGELLWGGVPQYSSLWGPPSGEEGRVVGSPTPINTLLPGDLLSGESM
ncbi:trinucleotide repeat-containing gene 6C protein isoform X1 [Notolabrus celidotus]|uniref:trinucleotide repeat-containing gene 6C protein isoform X1 n=1 Tax=Notolabrus celidotus TaxID=1203425 RepID=UPI00148F8631|nr:trinucleotide repeat-containing gene 6C protein isoform X1 [Notolabrus celidotus]XP_034567408.1 trinucleotide repeat-containing gene 6C protein isoform X1 [Notolabrus celidotus]XP_034567409.1 trinucleotide repeat-containing gene 6C protein isoform X1 [Notolabrus celidotus]